jgi:hypothetical protein
MSVAVTKRSSLTLWDFADPDEAVKVALDVYGSNATTAAAHCALTAHFDGRERDYRFWFAVFSKLNSGNSLGARVQ